MSSSAWEIILLWSAAGLYVLGTIFIAIGVIWANEKAERYSHYLTYAAIGLHTLSIGFRWYVAGRAPYQDPYEKLLFYPWCSIVMFVILVRIIPALKSAAILVYPATLLLLGLATLSSKEMSEVPATYETFWLIVHVLFAKLSYGSALMGTVTSICYVLKHKFAETKPWKWLKKLPSLDKLDYYSYRLTSFAFLMIGVMIVAGSIWAQQAWGRYWFWDPVETWSLISWLVYGLYCHYRFTGGKPRIAAIFNVFALFILIITFFITPYLYDSIHRS